MNFISTNNMVGIGLYMVPEASRLVKIPEQRIRRWLGGYSYISKGEKRLMPRLWDSQIGRIDDALVLGFQDLMEVRFVDRFVQHGVSVQTIRRALEAAKEIIGKQYPFSTRRFQTDGRTIFAEVLHDSGETHLLDLVKSQFAFASVITPSLYKDMDFSTDDEVLRWWPLGHKRNVVIDPGFAFGQPIVSESSIPTATLASAVEAEGSIEAVATWFGISKKTIKDAIAFEEMLAA